MPAPNTRRSYRACSRRATTSWRSTSVAGETGSAARTARWPGLATPLAFKLGVDHPDEIAAILAFSPASGEPMAGCMPEPYSSQIRQPVLVLRPIREFDNDWIAEQMRLFERDGHRTYIADPGVHGSSLLNETRVGASTDAAWAVVLDFLHSTLTEERKSR